MSVYANTRSIVNGICKLFPHLLYSPLKVRKRNINLSDKSPYVLNSIDLSVSDVFKKIEKLDMQGKMRPDGIPTILLKNCKFVSAQLLKILFDKSLFKGLFPMEWKSLYIVPIVNLVIRVVFLIIDQLQF